MNFWQYTSPNTAPSLPPIAERRRKGRRARRNVAALIPGMPPQAAGMADSAMMGPMTDVQRALILQMFGLGSNG